MEASKENDGILVLVLLLLCVVFVVGERFIVKYIGSES